MGRLRAFHRAGAVSRGRVGVSISVERLEEADGSLLLDEQKLASLAELLNRAPDLTGQPLPSRRPTC